MRRCDGGARIESRGVFFGVVDGSAGEAGGGEDGVCWRHRGGAYRTAVAARPVMAERWSLEDGCCTFPG